MTRETDWGGPPVITGEEPYRLDLQSEFAFTGRLQGPSCLSSYPYAAFSAEVPAHWVIASLDINRNRLPVPFGEVPLSTEQGL
jgi:hypothetical protein